MFPDHEHRSLPIGECVSIGPGDGALAGVVEFVEPSVPIARPMAEAVCHLCKAGVMNAISIGFLARDWEFAEDKARRDNGGADITSCELLEFSVVGIPCIPGALIQEIAADPTARAEPGAVKSANDSARGQRAAAQAHGEDRRRAPLERSTGAGRLEQNRFDWDRAAMPRRWICSHRQSESGSTHVDTALNGGVSKPKGQRAPSRT